MARVRNNVSPITTFILNYFFFFLINELTQFLENFLDFSSGRIFFVNLKVYDWRIFLQKIKIEAGIWKNRDGVIL